MRGLPKGLAADGTQAWKGELHPYTRKERIAQEALAHAYLAIGSEKSSKEGLELLEHARDYLSAQKKRPVAPDYGVVLRLQVIPSKNFPFACIRGMSRARAHWFLRNIG